METLVNYDKELFGGRLHKRLKSYHKSLIVRKGKENVLKSTRTEIIVTISNETELSSAFVLLILLLWGYLRKSESMKENQGVAYSLHQKIFHCSHSPFKLEIDYGHLVWKENSCYLDVLLMIIFFSEMICLRDAIFLGDCKNTQIKQVLETFYKFLLNGCRIAPNKLREAVINELPDLKEDSKYVFYSVITFYDYLTDAFPKLRLNVPLGTRMQQNSVIQILDYFYSHTTTNDINWKAYDEETLIFESNYTSGTLFSFNSPQDPRKRVLSEYILNARYKLSAAIILQSGHYICYYREPEGKIVKYNDLNGRNYVDNWPDMNTVTNSSIPIMFFYVKVKCPFPIILQQRRDNYTFILLDIGFTPYGVRKCDKQINDKYNVWREPNWAIPSFLRVVGV